MPYIKQEERDQIDPALEQLCSALIKAKDKEGKYLLFPTAGMLNYTISKLLSTMHPFPTYNDINRVVGILECAKMEFYRRVAAPYEDVKAGVNGDVYPPMNVAITKDV